MLLMIKNEKIKKIVFIKFQKALYKNIFFLEIKFKDTDSKRITKMQ